MAREADDTSSEPNGGSRGTWQLRESVFGGGECLVRSTGESDFGDDAFVVFAPPGVAANASADLVLYWRFARWGSPVAYSRREAPLVLDRVNPSDVVDSATDEVKSHVAAWVLRVSARTVRRMGDYLERAPLEDVQAGRVDRYRTALESHVIEAQHLLSEWATPASRRRKAAALERVRTRADQGELRSALKELGIAPSRAESEVDVEGFGPSFADELEALAQDEGIAQFFRER